jgi:hypothetical protein
VVGVLARAKTPTLGGEPPAALKCELTPETHTHVGRGRKKSGTFLPQVVALRQGAVGARDIVPALKVGVAKEIKPDEYRVALTPAGALELTSRGHEVLVETGAGLGSSFSDDAYSRVGARISSVEEAWGESDLLLKVKEPIASEYSRLRAELTLFTYLHIAADEPLTRALLDSGVTAVAYETVET